MAHSPSVALRSGLMAPPLRSASKIASTDAGSAASVSPSTTAPASALTQPHVEAVVLARLVEGLHQLRRVLRLLLQPRLALLDLRQARAVGDHQRERPGGVGGDVHR